MQRGGFEDTPIKVAQVEWLTKKWKTECYCTDYLAYICSEVTLKGNRTLIDRFPVGATHDVTTNSFSHAKRVQFRGV